MHSFNSDMLEMTLNRQVILSGLPSPLHYLGLCITFITSNNIVNNYHESRVTHTLND